MRDFGRQKGNGSCILMMTNGLKTPERLSVFLRAENINSMVLRFMYREIIWIWKEIGSLTEMWEECAA